MNSNRLKDLIKNQVQVLVLKNIALDMRLKEFYSGFKKVVIETTLF